MPIKMDAKCYTNLVQNMDPSGKTDAFMDDFTIQ